MDQALTANEIAAIQAAAQAGGEYLDTIRKTDLAKMTEAEWLTMWEAGVVTALNTLAKLTEKEIPF